MALVTALGVGLFLSALNVRYRDVPYAIPFLIADLAVPLGGRVRDRRAAGEVAVAARAESDDRRHQRLPVGRARNGPPELGKTVVSVAATRRSSSSSASGTSGAPSRASRTRSDERRDRRPKASRSATGSASCTARTGRCATRSRPPRRAGSHREHRPHYEEIWALRDVSFEVREGEVLGVIGRNGAGKSTLLKILTRITTPTTGRAEIRGRVGSLLEVGTGFHPELTGRENIFLNGAVLGMKRREIQRKFDEIVEFAGVEQFIDTPVKRYSSGMSVRLAFAVAAHLEPEILLVDEVLAVGDAEFQRRVSGGWRTSSQSGRTVALRLAQHAGGRAALRPRSSCSRRRDRPGRPSADIVAQYLQAGRGGGSARVWDDLESAPGDDLVRLRSVRVVDEDGEVASSVDVRKPVGIEIGSTCSPTAAGLPEDQGVRPARHVVFNALDTSRGGRSRRAGRVRLDGLDPR